MDGIVGPNIISEKKIPKSFLVTSYQCFDLVVLMKWVIVL